jgi:hypothetical protein
VMTVVTPARDDNAFGKNCGMVTSTDACEPPALAHASPLQYPS